MCAQEGRARALLAEPDSATDPIPLYREVLAHTLRIQRTLPELEMGAPLVYGVEAVGAVEDVRTAAADPAVASFEPGWRRDDEVVVTQPAAPADRPDAPDPETDALTPDQVRARIAQLADNGGLGSCANTTGP